MGVKIFDILRPKSITWKELEGKTLAVDASLYLHQFLASIRQRDGTPLTDSKGRTTSHLVGLFSRTAQWLERGIKPIYVFDGKPPELKEKVREERRVIKEEAKEKYRQAVVKGNIEEMKKYASRTSILTKEIVSEAKELLQAMGVPTVQAPSEAEAQAAYMTIKGDAWAVASQDSDAILFGAERLVRNLAISGKKKKAGKLSYENITPEIYHAKDVLNNLGIDREQLIALSILVGTDYEPAGIKGIGSKTALKLVKENGKNFEELFKKAEWEKHSKTPWKEIMNTFKNIPVTTDYTTQPKSANAKKIMEILVQEHEFSKERVEETITKIGKTTSQQGLAQFFR
ncbi:flap endonuclease-1 [Candidatus Woesearchaeota archaeon]|nr:flap endonuclease-1 [Candidatus Woesearchaeota archaeon]